MKTAIVEARLDLRTLAALHRFFTARGRPPTSRSDLLWLSAEFLVELLRLSKGPTEEALQYFRAVGWEMTKGGRTRRALSKALQDEAISMDFADADMQAGDTDIGDVLADALAILREDKDA